MMRSLSLPSKRRATSCSVLALATVLVVGATPAAAQSFLGEGTVTHGAGTITTGVNTTNIAVTTPQTVIDWIPTDNAIANNTAIAFQNSGTTASFSGPVSYAVLNRINPADSTRNILLNGTIQTVAAGAGGGANGSIYFYSPGGFVIGANAVINVGSLVLSASPITVTGGEFIGGFGTTNTVTFGQAGQAGAAIATIAGSAITANGGDAYVAMVAPRVQHGGNISVSGSAALVGAEAATINFSPDGLFDIQVTAGSTDANGVYNNGNISWSAGTGAGDIRRAYLVAVPKNAAMTMLITTGSDLGFEVAGSADLVGNTVVLSAGHDIANGSISGVSAGSTGAAIANLDVRDSSFTSAMVGEATGTALLSGYSALKFYSSVSVHADGEVWLSTQLPGGSVDIDGSLSLSTEQFGNNGEDVASSRVQIFNLNGGSINVDGSTTIDTDAWGGWSGVAGVNGGDATAGEIDVRAGTDGDIALLGGLTASADGRAGGAFDAGVDGGVGTGGKVQLRTTGDASTLTVNNGVTINARGYGGSGAGGECFLCDGDGGTGQGGDIRIVGQSGTGSTLTLNGSVSAIADGFGGAAQAATAAAGAGTGGNADFYVGTGNLMTLTGNLLLQAEGVGGNHFGGDGGTGRGGRAALAEAAGSPGGNIVINGNVELSTDGTGGNSSGSGDVGGAGFGGDDITGAYVYAQTASITINGGANVHSTGTGGTSFNGVGGDGTGGYARLRSDSQLTITGSSQVSADASGGDGAVGGGDAQGGDVGVTSFAMLQLGALTASANATGGDVFPTDTSGWLAGNAVGGDVDVYAQGGTLTLSGAAILSTDATGGSVGNTFDVGGNGTGGTTRLLANASGSVDLQSTLDATAIGSGGGSDYYSSGIGGNGQGGAVRVQATAANASITIAGAATLDASGEGSDSVGGNGTGGTAWVDSFGAATASLDFQSNVTAFAQGRGGDHNNGTGGNGQGGQAVIHAINGSTQSIGGSATVNTDAFGGDSNDFSDGVGGNAVGGLSYIQTDTGVGTIDIDGNATVTANGSGGASYSYAGGIGGNGTGGSAQLLATPGTVTIGDIQSGGDVSVTADGYGGNASDGTGGNGTGGSRAEIAATDGGSITIHGYAGVSGSGFGGDGLFGGNGTGSGSTAIPGNGAFILARNGDITILGGAGVSAVGIGGDGSPDFNGYNGDHGGDGGDGTGGWASIFAANSNLGPSLIDIDGGSGELAGSVIVDVSGTGGDGGNGVGGNLGGNGGDGGNGKGGTALVHAAAGNGTVNIGTLSMDATATGGSGGVGGNGDSFAGGNGGNGGNALGGIASVGTESGGSPAVNNGQGIYGSIYADASATGGTGGNGNFGATDGTGGNGGDAVNGRALLLVRGSLVDADVVNLVANATGGNGGLGGGDTGGGGNGGDATIGGGDFNNGGTLNGVDVVVTERIGNTAQRGTLIAGNITGTSIATAGLGTVDGISQSLGGNVVVFRNSNGTLGSLDFLIQADTIGTGAIEDAVAVHPNGTVTVAGAFDFVTSGNLSLLLDNATLTANTIKWHAADFVPDTVTVTPAVAGTFFANSFDIQTGNNFLTTAHLDSVETLTIVAPGLISANNMTVDADLFLEAQGGGITANNLDVTDAIDLDAFGAINLNLVNAGFFHADAGGTFTSDNITSDSNIQINSGDDVVLGNLIAGLPAGGSNKAIRIISGGSVLVQNINSIGGIDITAAGAVDGQNVTTGDVLFTDALGAIQYDNISAGFINPQVPTEPFSVGLVSGASISVGNVNALRSIGLVAAGALTSGSLTTTADLIGLADGNMSFGAINAGGRVLLADYSMYTNAGGTIPTSDGFDPELVFAATPVASSGSIFVNGPIAANSLQAAAGTSFTSGNIVSNGLISIAAGTSIGTGSITNTANTSLNAGTSINVGAINSGTGAVSLIAGTSFISGQTVAAGSIFADSGGDMSLGNLTAGGDIELVAVGDILIGNALAGESIDMDAGGYIDGGTMTAGDSVYAEAGESVDLLNISAGIVNQSNGYDADYNVGLLAGTTIETGDIEAFNSIGLGAAGDIYTGSIDAGDIFLALSGGNMSVGFINAGGVTYLADDSMIPLGGNPSEGDFDPAPILAALPTSSGGSITLRGPVTTGRFVAAAGTTLTGTTIDSDSSIYAVSGGNTTLTDLDAGGSITLASPGSITTGDIDAGGIFMALGHGDMSFGDATASEVYLADYAMFVTGGSGGSITVTCIGTCGTSGANGVVIAPPNGTSYSYVTTDGGVTGAGQIPGEGGTNGSLYTTSAFAAAAGDDLNFWFNYVTSDGSDFNDYAWAGLFTTALSPVATLFTARTQPLGSIVPGQNLPGVEATLNPQSVPIVAGAPSWAPLGSSSGVCYDAGCGFTGWVNSTYDIPNAGNYVVQFGVTNWTDTGYQSGMAFSGITVGGVAVQPGLTRTGGSISIGNVDTGKFTAAAGTSFTSGLINSGGSIDIDAGGNITAGTMNAGSYIDVFSDTGLLDLADLHAVSQIDLETGGSIEFGDVTADDFNFEAGGTVNGGNIVAVSHADGHAEGALTLKDVTVTGPPNDDDDFSIGFTSATSIKVEDIDGFDRVGFATLGDLTTGNIAAGSLMLALAGGDIVTGSITTDAGGRVYMANASMCGGACGDDDNEENEVEAEDILALAPVPTGGSITINGAVTTGLFQAAAGDNFTARAITAQTIEASAGDNATVDGTWSANEVLLQSGDIDITTNGRIDAGSSGEVTLNAVNDGGGAVIGDGVTGPGYALSNAEFGRISGGDITIVVGGNGGDADTLIGDLTITGPLAGSNIESNDGGVHFITLQEDGAAFDGTLRVAGDVVATGFGPDNYLAFYTQNFELDAATGSISITGAGGALAGTLELVASRIHVAEGSLLDQLAANPQFAGYRQALNRQAAVQRPDGVIRAANFDIEFDGSDITGPYTLFVQNMGTTTVPAGFLLNAANIVDDSENSLAAGSIDMAINGQIIADGGTLTGIAVRDLLVTEFGTSVFVAGSTINGCPLVGACLAAPPPRIDTPTRTDVPLNDSSGLGDGVDGSLSNPPAPLLETIPLGQSGDVDDPVSGAGNPSLYGSPDEDANVEVCDSTKDDKCKTGTKGDGK